MKGPQGVDDAQEVVPPAMEQVVGEVPHHVVQTTPVTSVGEPETVVVEPAQVRRTKVSGPVVDAVERGVRVFGWGKRAGPWVTII